MKNKLIVLFFLALSVIMIGCESEADTVNQNLTKSADSFDVQRRIVFINGITDKYLMTIEGLCSMDFPEDRIRVTCKVGDDLYKRHYLGLSDNVTFMAEQIEAKKEDPFHHKIIFRPESIIPDIEIQTSK